MINKARNDGNDMVFLPIPPESTYLLDFQKMQQVNIRSHFTRDVKCMLAPDTVMRCVQLREGDPITGQVPNWSVKFASSVSKARKALESGLKLPPTGVLCLSSNQTKRDGRDVYYYLSTGPFMYTPLEMEDRTSLNNALAVPSAPGMNRQLSAEDVAEEVAKTAGGRFTKMTVLRLQDNDPLLDTLQDFSETFGGSISKAQQMIKARQVELPDGGVVCLSTNQSKKASRPVYFFLSVGASGGELTMRKRKKITEVYTLPEDLRSGKYDTLGLRKNPDIEKLMAQTNETVVFSNKLIKFNHVNKRQERVILVTSQAVYNYGIDRYKKPKSRLGFNEITAVTQTSIKQSNEFMLQVPSQHDYRFFCLQRDTLLMCLSKAYAASMDRELRRNYSRTTHLKALCITKGLPVTKRKKLMALQQTLKTVPPEVLMKEAEGGEVSEMYNGWSNEKQRALVSLKDFTLTKVTGPCQLTLITLPRTPPLTVTLILTGTVFPDLP